MDSSKEKEDKKAKDNSEDLNFLHTVIPRDDIVNMNMKKNEDYEIGLTKNAIKVLEKRYLKKNEDGEVIESPLDMFRRVARSIAMADLLYDEKADIKKTEEEFFKMMIELEFLPNSPTLMNAGRELGQLSACFVLPIEDSMESIFEAVKNTALIHKSGGGTGFSFSRLRPANDSVSSTGGIASGPVSFMKVFNASTEVIKQGGTRRGANMAILRVDHPDIMEFITCKKENTELNNFNISVGVTDDFMKCVEEDREYSLINPRNREVIDKLKARDVFRKIVEMAWKNGEPGLIFLDRVNEDNPTSHIERIESTNPCGEQPLLPYESCNLGSINLAKMIIRDGDSVCIDFDRIAKLTSKAVHFLDNVIDVNKYPIPKIEEMTRGNRKIGLGVMGFADMLIQLNIPYDSEEAAQIAEKVMSFITLEGRKASIKLAEKRGVFLNYKGSTYEKVRKEKVRNATVTTIAPTGTLSIIAGSSSGIEPIFAISYVRNVLDNEELAEVNSLFEKIARAESFYSDELMLEIARKGSAQLIEGISEDIKRIFKVAHDITWEWHIRIQAAFQKHTDNAVSKTINFPFEATTDDVEKAYLMAYKSGCKGLTIYRDGSREQQVLCIRRDEKDEDETQRKITPRTRPSVTVGKTVKIGTGCGNLYVTINEDNEGLCEVFASMGKSGGCAASQSEATSRLISLALRSGVETEAILKQLRGIRCPSPLWHNGQVVMSCPDAICKAIEIYIKGGLANQTKSNNPHSLSITSRYEPPKNPVRRDIAGMCPECGSTIEFVEGCAVCRFCGFSRCN